MALQTTGTISFANIQTEFGGSHPITMVEYYGESSLPTSGTISLNNFRGTSSIQYVSLTTTNIIEIDYRTVTRDFGSFNSPGTVVLVRLRMDVFTGGGFQEGKISDFNVAGTRIVSNLEVNNGAYDRTWTTNIAVSGGTGGNWIKLRDDTDEDYTSFKNIRLDLTIES